MPRWMPFEMHFWTLADVGDEDACWEWKGDTYGQGYGRVHHAGRRQPAHRVAFELTIGPIPEGLLVCHHCDNKPCVNPKHLFAGTQHDNMQDWTRKGKNRLANDRSLWSNGKHFKNPEPRAKVAVSMRAQYATGTRAPLRAGNGRYAGSKIVGRS